MSLLTLSYLNTACFLSLNESDTKYNMCLEMAEDDLEDVLKPEFYSQIVAQYPNYTGDNAALYDPYIKKYLAWQTYYHYLKFSNMNATPSGIREFTDDNSTLASDVKMYGLEKVVLNQANKRKFKMINFLNEAKVNDSSKYPLWEHECKEEMSFSITAIDKTSDALIRVDKTIITNE